MEGILFRRSSGPRQKKADQPAPGNAIMNKAGGMQLVGLPLSDVRAKRFLQQFLPALRDHLEQQGWQEQYIQHIADEPVDENAASYKAISAYV